VQGFLALAKMQSGANPELKAMVDSLQLQADDKSVALSFTVPTEVLDALEQLGKAKVQGLQ
jgi:hypothetical protein